MSRANDLAPLFFPPPSNEVGFRQGQVIAFDLSNGQNIIDVGGAQLVDVPLLNVTDSVSLAPGVIVGLLKWKSSWWIIGRVILPNSPGYGALCAFENNGEGVCITQNGIDIYPPDPPDDVARIFAQHFASGAMWLEMIPPRTQGGTGDNRIIIEGNTDDIDGATISPGSFSAITAGNASITAEQVVNIAANGGDVNIDSANSFIVEAQDHLILTRGGSAFGTFIDVNTTTAGSPNAQLDNATNPRVLLQNTSSRRYKLDIEDLHVNPSAVLQLQPRTWRDKAQVDKAQAEGRKETRRYAGFIAEEVDDIEGMELFITRDNQTGKIQSVAYDRLSAALISVVKGQQSQIDALSARLDALEARHA